MRVMFYFDEGCISKALVYISGIMDDNNIKQINITTSYKDDPNYFMGYKFMGYKKDGKEWVSYVLFGDDKEKQDKIDDFFKETDWDSLGITGFEEIKVLKVTETDVELRPIGIIDIDDESVLNDKVYKMLLKQQNDSNELLKEIREMKNKVKMDPDSFYKYDLAIKAAIAYHIVEEAYEVSEEGAKRSNENIPWIDAKNMDEYSLNYLIKVFCETNFDLIHKFALEIFKDKLLNL